MEKELQELCLVQNQALKIDEVIKTSFYKIKFKECQENELVMNFLLDELIKHYEFLGFKGEIQENNLLDLINCLKIHALLLTLHEIKLVFEMERYGLFDTKTEHFQLFNAIYISDLFKKYKEFKRNRMIEKNISFPKKEVLQIEDKSYQDDYFKIVFDEIQNNGYSDKVAQKWNKFKDKVKLNPKEAHELYEKELVKFTSEILKKSKGKTEYSKEKQEFKRVKIIVEKGEPLIEVQNICRNIIISEYLKQFNDFEEFKKEF